MTTTICRKILYNVADDSQKPNIIDLINRSMPQMIVDELKKKGVVTIIYDETDQTVTYTAGNDYFEPDLRLDYTYNQEGILLDYVNKEYGFTEQMKDENDIEQKFDSKYQCARYLKSKYKRLENTTNKHVENQITQAIRLKTRYLGYTFTQI